MTTVITKPRILVIQPSMVIGGAERALLGLLDSIDYKSYDVDLLLYSHTGDFISLINKNVKIIPYDKKYDIFHNPIGQLILRAQFKAAIKRIRAKFVDKWYSLHSNKAHSVWHAQQIIHKYLNNIVPDIIDKYDLAINFLGVPSILVNHVNAKVKATWIHTDYSKLVVDSELDRQMYDAVDWIVNVSDDCKRVFDGFYPEYADKSIVIENILNSSLVQKLADADEAVPFTVDRLNLLSIGRFAHVKNFESIPQIARLMVDAGAQPFKWYIIGYGGTESLIRENIAKYGVDDYVEILGKRVNPYPYIKACDVYLQPSRFEGKAVTVREAQMLGRPVVVTAYDTAPSQIRHGIDGIILPMDPVPFAAALTPFLADHQRLAALAAHCTATDFTNTPEIEKIYKLIN